MKSELSFTEKIFIWAFLSVISPIDCSRQFQNCYSMIIIIPSPHLWNIFGEKLLEICKGILRECVELGEGSQVHEDGLLDENQAKHSAGKGVVGLLVAWWNENLAS